MVKKMADLELNPSQLEALHELRQRLVKEFDVEAIILYGSMSRGEADEESDLDLLIITPTPLTRFARHKITGLAFEVNLRYGTNLSTLVIDRHSWEAGAVSVLPLRDNILK